MVPEKVVITATVVNRLGLHARPAMSFVDAAAAFASTIRVRREETEVDGKSIMQMMMLAASKGSQLEITAEGVDAKAAADALAKLVASGFDEE
jgi:phosphocarrier protein